MFRASGQKNPPVNPIGCGHCGYLTSVSTVNRLPVARLPAACLELRPAMNSVLDPEDRAEATIAVADTASAKLGRANERLVVSVGTGRSPTLRPAWVSVGGRTVG
ncbi:MAG: hypothetical protein O2931_17720 [Planctomycetota bacterium]|nr:hypothetical protein [Planctomycetota bacterium]MDA1180620.1 hypothetical protein [Planctomycetota bacterium]